MARGVETFLRLAMNSTGNLDAKSLREIASALRDIKASAGAGKALGDMGIKQARLDQINLRTEIMRRREAERQTATAIRETERAEGRKQAAIRRTVAETERLINIDTRLQNAQRRTGKAYETVMQGALNINRLLAKSEVDLTRNIENEAHKRMRIRERERKAMLYSLRAGALDMSYLLGNLSRQAGGALLGIGGAALGVGGAAVAKHAQFQDYRAQLRTLGDRDGSMWEKTKQFALLSPLTFEDTVKGVVQLIRYGETADDVFGGLLKTMTKLSVFAGRPLDQVARVFEKAKAGKNWNWRELTPLGITPDFVKQQGIALDKKGRPAGLDETTGPQIVGTLLAALEKQLRDYRPEDLLKVKLTNIKDAVDLFLDQLGGAFDRLNAPVLDKIRNLIVKIAGVLNSPEMQRGFQQVVNQLIPIADKLIDWVDRMIQAVSKNPDLIPKFFHNLAEAIKALFAVWAGAGALAGGASIAQGIITMFLNPEVAVPLVIALGAAILLLKGKLDALIPSVEGAGKAIGNDAGGAAGKGLLGAIAALGGALESLGKKIQPMIEWLNQPLNDALSGSLYALAGALDVVANVLDRIDKLLSSRNLQEFLGNVKGMAAQDAAKNAARGNALKAEGAAPGGVYGDPLALMNAQGISAWGPSSTTWSGIADIRQADDSRPRRKAIVPGAGAAAAEFDRKGYVSSGLDILGDVDVDVARAAAKAVTGLTDNTCAATVIEYLHRLGIEVPRSIVGTQALSDWLEQHGAERVKPGDAQGLDILFSKDGNGNLRPDHTGIALGAAAGGRLSFKDNKYNKRSEGLGYFDYGLRIPDSMLASGLEGAPGLPAALSNVDMARPGIGRLDRALDMTFKLFGQKMDAWNAVIQRMRDAGSNFSRALEAGAEAIKKKLALESLNFSIKQGAVNIRQALAQQSGDDRGAAYFGLLGQGNQINELFRQLGTAGSDPAAREQIQSALAQAITGLIGSRTDLKEKAPDIFGQWGGFQNEAVARYEREFGNLTDAQSIVVNQFGQHVAAFGQAVSVLSGKPVGNGLAWASPLGGAASRFGAAYARSAQGGIAVPGYSGGGGGYWDDNPAGATDQELYGCETGSCQTRYYHPGGGEIGMPGQPDAGAFPEEQKKAKQGVNGFTKSMQRLTGLVNSIAGIVGQWQSGDKVGAGGSLVDLLFPQLGGLGSAVAGLFNAFKSKRGAIVEKIIDPVKFDVESLSQALGAGPGSALYGMRGRVGGAAWTIHTSVQIDGAEVAKATSRHVGSLNFQGAM